MIAFARDGTCQIAGTPAYLRGLADEIEERADVTGHVFGVPARWAADVADAVRRCAASAGPQRYVHFEARAATPFYAVVKRVGP